MIREFISPLSESQIQYFRSLPANRWGTTVDFYQGEEGLDLKGYDLALIGVNEERNSDSNEGCAEGPDFVRNELYQLVKNTLPLKWIDLGNLHPGNQISDTYIALSAMMDELMHQNVIPIIIGGSHDLTLAQFKGYQEMGKELNLIVVDERIDLIDMDGPVSDINMLSALFAEEDSQLEGFSLLGYQTYFTDAEAIHTMERLKFDCYRLGDIRKNMEETEPIVRDADLLSFDVAAIKQGDAPGHRMATPNGFYGEEACQITRYAGLSDRLSSIGFYGFNPAFDNGTQTAQLLAQMIWYFTEGFYARKNDDPLVNEKEYLKYIVDFNEGEYELIFWKSRKSDRWWLQIPESESDDKPVNPYKNLISCSYADYQQALRDELPERWVKAFERV